MGVYRAKNGKWYCAFMIKGKRVHKLLDGAKDKEQAKELEDAERYRERLKQQGLIKEEKKITLSYMLSRYKRVSEINNRRPEKAELFSQRIESYFGANKDISKIKPSDVEGFKSFYLKEGKSPATVNRYLSGLKRAFNILIKDDVINYNPVNRVEYLTETGRRNRYLSKEEWIRLKECLPPDIQKIVMFALLSGLRKMNVLLCDWSQIDLQLRTIEFLKTENKGEKRIIIPINNKLYELLLSLNPKPSGYIFLNPKTGKPYTDIKKSWHTALKKAGIQGLIFHDLRRTVGTWLKEEGVDIHTIQHILAHSDITTTERYLCITPKHTKVAMDVLNSYI